MSATNSLHQWLKMIWSPVLQVTALWQFFLIRMLTGIAVGGCFPLVFSLLGDLFPISQRSAMAALVQIAVGAGIGGGQVGAALGCWEHEAVGGLF